MSSSYSPSTDLSPVSDATGAPLDDEYLAFYSYNNSDLLSWSPKKDYQIPRSQSYYPDLKPPAVFIMPRQEDEGWHHGGRHFQSQIGPYSSSPRIKQEDISAFPSYPDLPNPISYDFQQQHLQIQTHAHEPNGNSTFQLLSPLQCHPRQAQSQQSTTVPYYSPPFHHQHNPQPPAPASASFYPPPPAGTIHPAELSPTTSCSPVSPLSAYTDISGGVAAPPVGMSCDPHLAITGWREDRRNSLASLESELSELGSMMVDVIGPGVAIGGLPLGMEGIPHSTQVSSHTHTMPSVEDVGSEEDAEGEDECQWEQQNNVPQGQYQVIPQQHVHYQHQQQYDDINAEQHHNDASRSDQPHPTSEGEDEIDEGPDDSARSDISANGRNNAPASPASASASASTSDEPYEFDDDESDEDYDDPRDGEFVLPSRSSRRRTSSLPRTARSASGSHRTGSSDGNAGGEYPSFQYMTGEGRSLRPRSTSRYNPYPTSSSFENGFYNQNGQYHHHPQEQHGKRYASSSPSAISGRSGSSSSTTGANTVTTTLSSASSATANSRRRLRPATSLPIPVPVPNLTKKSRGRRVPTMSSIEDLRSASSGAGKKRQGAPTGKTVRMYLCEVDGCGKCFARGEHLKRHVRSIHTYEKRAFFPSPCLFKLFRFLRCFLDF